MEKQIRNFTIIYKEIDSSYIDIIMQEVLKEELKIINFFKAKLHNSPIYIKFWDNKEEFKKHIVTSSDIKKNIVPNNPCGKLAKIDDKLVINLLSYKERSKKNKLDEIALMATTILHELVHIYHAEARGHKKTLLWIKEALATNLAPQYSDQDLKLNCDYKDLINDCQDYKNYYTMGRYLFDNCDHNYILELANNPIFLVNESENIFYKTKEYLNQINKTR
jgi:hypothetical protein